MALDYIFTPGSRVEFVYIQYVLSHPWFSCSTYQRFSKKLGWQFKICIHFLWGRCFQNGRQCIIWVSFSTNNLAITYPNFTNKVSIPIFSGSRIMMRLISKWLGSCGGAFSKMAAKIQENFSFPYNSANTNPKLANKVSVPIFSWSRILIRLISKWLEPCGVPFSKWLPKCYEKILISLQVGRYKSKIDQQDAYTNIF